MATAKKKTQKADTKKENKGSTNVFESVKAALGTDSSIPEIQSEDYFYAYTYGIPIRNYLPLCRLFGTDVLPLSRAFTIVGKEETLKSSIGWFFMKLIIEAGGFCVFVDTEHKTSWPLVRSIVDVPGVFLDESRRVFPFQCETKEKAQNTVYKVCSDYEKMDDAISGGKRVPMGILYDSLKAGESEAVVKSQEESDDTPGFASMHSAQSLQRTLNSTIGMHLQCKPIVFMGINHSMPKRTVTGQVQGTYESGGHFKDFVWSGNIEMMKTSEGQEQSAERNRTLVQMRMKKSSLNEKQIKPVPIQMEQRIDSSGNPHTRFFWDKTLSLLLSDSEIFPKTRTKQALTVVRQDKQNYTCEKLGITKENSVSPEAMGRILNNSPEWQEAILRNVFHIEPGGILYNGEIHKPISQGQQLPESSGTLNGLKVNYVQTPPVRTVLNNDWPENARDPVDQDNYEQAEEHLNKEKTDGDSDGTECQRDEGDSERSEK